MALTRKFLSALSIEADKIDEIITAHSETVDALKADRDKYKADAEKYEEAQKKLDEATKSLEEFKKNAGNNAELQKKYEALDTEFKGYKKATEEKETKAKKTEAFKKILKEVGISEKRMDAVLKVSGDEIDSIKFDSEGKVENSDDLKKSINENWADFKVTENVTGAGVTNPPQGGGSGNTASAASERAKRYFAEKYGAVEKKD